MQMMEKERRLCDYGGGGEDFLHAFSIGSSSPSRSLQVSSPQSAVVALGADAALNCIMHHVSKFDTLAGVAIKYGVEVADIKRLNGLVTDHQMFALNTLQIPLPGRHPPSPSLSDANETPRRSVSFSQTPSSCRHSNLLGSFQSLKLKSSSENNATFGLSSLQDYGLIINQKASSQGFEMAVYQKGGAHYLEDVELAKSSLLSNPPLSHHRKTKSVANGFFDGKGNLISQLLSQEAEDSDSDNWTEKSIRRRQKSEADFGCRTPEKLVKEENFSGGAISSITGKSLALRPKSTNRTPSMGVDGEAGAPHANPFGAGGSLCPGSINRVRKSSSTSNLHESDNSTLASIWPTSKWSLKADFQALSTAAMARPIFDGLPKPLARRNKAALD